MHQRAGSRSCFPVLPNASWPTMLIFLRVLDYDFRWVQGLLLGTDPDGRIAGVGGACRLWLCNSWAPLEDGRALILLSARGTQTEACAFAGAAGPKFRLGSTSICSEVFSFRSSAWTASATQQN